MEAQLYLLKNIGARAIILTMNILTVLVFSGAMLTTPFAWVFVAISSAAKWCDQQIIPMMRLEKKLIETKNLLKNSNADKEKLKPLDVDELERHIATLSAEIANKRAEMA